MGIRFHKRVKLFPGVAINLSKSGASVSVGGRGFHETFSTKGIRTTAGIPGTGLSYSTVHSYRSRRSEVARPTTTYTR